MNLRQSSIFLKDHLRETRVLNRNTPRPLRLTKQARFQREPSRLRKHQLRARLVFPLGLRTVTCPRVTGEGPAGRPRSADSPSPRSGRPGRLAPGAGASPGVPAWPTPPPLPPQLTSQNHGAVVNLGPSAGISCSSPRRKRRDKQETSVAVFKNSCVNSSAEEMFSSGYFKKKRSEKSTCCRVSPSLPS